MNNIILLQEHDFGMARKRQPGQKMSVDPETRDRLIAGGIAEAYDPSVEIKDKKQTKTAKAQPREVTAPAKAAPQKLD